MVMDVGLFSTLRKLKLSSSSLRVDDDFVDRLNHYYTAIIIIVFTIIVSAKQYVGQPLQCWVPAQYTRAMEQYAENYCWVQNTYWLPLHAFIPRSTQDRHDRKIGYYQWVPFILVAEALMFYMPCVIWRLLNWQSGIHLQGIVRMACDTGNVNPENRAKMIRTVARHIENVLDAQEGGVHASASASASCAPSCTERTAHLLRTGLLITQSRRTGHYLITMYLVVKLAYIGNVVGQFFLLNRFLHSPYRFYGIGVLADLARGYDWHESGQFPRVTMCDFEIRVLGNLHKHTIQCVLMINLFNEKIFVFLWFWYLVLALFTVVSLLVWMLRALSPQHRERAVYKYIRLKNEIKFRDRKTLRTFTRYRLKADGVFVLQMISVNAGEVIASDVAYTMWQNYYQKKVRGSYTNGDTTADTPAYV